VGNTVTPFARPGLLLAGGGVAVSPGASGECGKCERNAGDRQARQLHAGALMSRGWRISKPARTLADRPGPVNRRGEAYVAPIMPTRSVCRATRELDLYTKASENGTPSD